MHYSDPVPPEKHGTKKTSRKKPVHREPVPCVMESAPGTPGSEKIEKVLSDILAKLERIEEKIDEAVYPPESAIRPAYVKKIKALNAGTKTGKGTSYPSMQDFIRNIKQ